MHFVDIYLEMILKRKLYRELHLLFVIIVLSGFVCSITCCSGSREKQVMDNAESLMESQPDSAFELLKSIDRSSLNSRSEKARYALLMSMALDKNYIDTTTFDVLQPAIDYYLKKGTPDEKLRTYYYQGRIYQNMGDRDNALNSFAKSTQNLQECTDSLTIVRALVAQAYLYYEFYDIKSYILCNLEAADISGKLAHKDYEVTCLLNALNGAIAENDKELADSLMPLCKGVEPVGDAYNQRRLGLTLLYTINFGTKKALRELVEHNSQQLLSDIDNALDLASAYNKLGDNDMAARILNYVNESGSSFATLKYKSILVYINKDTGNYKEALSAYEDFSQDIDSINYWKFERKVESLEDKHQLELKAEVDARQKTKIIWGCIAGLIILGLIVVILALLVRSNKTKRDLAIHKVKITDLENDKLKRENELTREKARLSDIENERLRQEKELASQKARASALENERLKMERELALQEVRIAGLENDKLTVERDLVVQKSKTTSLENEILKSEKEKLELSNRNLQLERDNKALEAENFAHRVEILKEESERLRKLLDERNDIPTEVRDAIRIRVEMLNSHLARVITSNAKFGKPYDTWIEEMTNNTEEFMNSTRLAFQVSHPGFIKYLIDHGLTISEINYVCLYAVGLNGQEVGAFIKKRSHVNMSSAIRKKLGLDQHATNLSIYIRRLLNDL